MERGCDSELLIWYLFSAILVLGAARDFLNNEGLGYINKMA